MVKHIDVHSALAQYIMAHGDHIGTDLDDEGEEIDLWSWEGCMYYI